MEKDGGLLKLRNIRYSALMVVCMLTSFLLSERTRSVQDRHSTGRNFTHLLTFAANYGAQMWVTFAAGLTMFYSIPRCMFGQLQSRLFPVYFLWCLVTSSVVLATYIGQNPDWTMWSRATITEVILQALGVVGMAINCIVISPLTVGFMREKFVMEEQAGVANVVGHADLSELKKNPKFWRAHTNFRIYHSMGAICNLISMIANTYHLYNLAQVPAPS